MRRNWKRLTGVLLALLLCLGCLPTVSVAAAEDWGAVTHMNIFGAGTDLRGRNYPYARYDDMIADLLDEEGRPDFSDEADSIRYRKAGVMFQAATVMHEQVREYYFCDPGYYEIAFYATQRLDADAIALSGAVSVGWSFAERILGSGQYRLYVYTALISLEGSGTVYVSYEDQNVQTLTMTQISEEGAWPTTMLVSGYRELSDGVISELTLSLTGFNLPTEAGAYALWDSENEGCLAKATAVSGDDRGLSVTFSFDGGMSAEMLSAWPNLYINGSLSYYYVPEEDRDWRYEQYGFVQLPSIYSGTMESGLEAINVTNAGATYIEGAPVFSGDYSDYPPEPHLGLYMGLGMPLWSDMDYVMGMCPAYFFSAETGDTLHEIYLYGTEALDATQLRVCGTELVEPFTLNTYGDGLGTLYFYRGVIAKPDADGYIGIVYRDAPLYTLPAYQVADYSAARLPFDWDQYSWDEPDRWYEQPAPLICTCWVQDYETDEAGVMSSFDVAFSGFNLPTDYQDYSLHCFEAEDAGEVFASASGLRVDEYGKTVVTFTVVNPRYATATTYPQIYGCATNYLAYYSSGRGSNYTVSEQNGIWRVTEALKTYGMYWGATVRVFSPYKVLEKDYTAIYGAGVDFTWPADGAVDGSVTVEALVSGDELRRNQFEEDESCWTRYTVLLAVYDENGRMLDLASREITSPQRVSLTADAEGAASASLFCLRNGTDPIKSRVTARP